MYLKRLKEIRLNNGLTQKEIATILGIDRSTYTAFENGQDIIGIERLNAFVNYFKTSFDYIFEFTNDYQYQNSKLKINVEVVGKRLKETRVRAFYTQEAVAQVLNTNHSVWCRYEQGKFLINATFLYSYACEIGVSADYLLGKIEVEKYFTKEKVKA